MSAHPDMAPAEPILEAGVAPLDTGTDPKTHAPGIEKASRSSLSPELLVPARVDIEDRHMARATACLMVFRRWNRGGWSHAQRSGAWLLRLLLAVSCSGPYRLTGSTTVTKRLYLPRRAPISRAGFGAGCPTGSNQGSGAKWARNPFKKHHLISLNPRRSEAS